MLRGKKRWRQCYSNINLICMILDTTDDCKYTEEDKTTVPSICFQVSIESLYRVHDPKRSVTRPENTH